MGLQALIFGVDGTLAETADIHRAAFNQSFEEFKTGWHWDRRAFSYLMNMAHDAEMLNAFNGMCASKNNLSVIGDEVLAQILLRKAQIYLAMLARGAACLRQGVGRLIAEARREEITLAIMSERPRIDCEMLITNILGFDAFGMFDSVRTYSDRAENKNLFQLVLNDLGIEPANTIAIDDTELGIKQATACGIKTVATPGVYTSSGRFDAAELVLSDLGCPSRPYDVILGVGADNGFVTLEYLRQLTGDRRAAA